MSISISQKIEERGYLQLDDVKELPKDLNRKQVRSIICHDLQITSLPDELSSLTFIHIIDLSGTQISGKALKHLPPRLKKLDISDCEEIDVLPSLKSYSYLKELNLSETYITAYSLEKLPLKIEQLNLSHCPALEKLPASFAELNELEILDITATTIGDSSLKHLPKNLVELSASNCKKIIKLPKEMKKLERLEILKVGNKYFKFKSLKNLSDKRLQYLTLCDIEIEKLLTKRWTLILHPSIHFEQVIQMVSGTDRLKEMCPNLKKVSIAS